MIKRYTRPAMGALFTDKHKFDTWLTVELAVCEAWAETGAIPSEAYQRIKRKARFTLKRIEEIEEVVQHDVVAFTTAVADYIGDDSAYFHRGLTSSDVVDTAQNIVLKEAGHLLEPALVKLRVAVGKRALEHRQTPMIGRTHGVHAEPTTLGLKFLLWYDELLRHEERLGQAIDTIAVGKLSGAVGNFAHIPPAFEEVVLRKLGLQAAPVSNQIVQRDCHAQFLCALALLGATLEKIAVNLRTMQRTELGEVEEPFGKGQKGSSAMPHKKNPILLERITGLARVLRGYALTGLENVALWDERDISHSGAERVILPDACILLDYMLAKLTGVIEGLVVHVEQMKRNIFFTRGLVFSQRVLLRLAEAGLSREQAYALVQRNALRCWDDGTPLLDALLNDREVRAVLKPEQISELFSLEPYLARVDEIFQRVGLLPSGKGAKPQDARRPRGGGDGTVRDAEGHIDSVTLSTGAMQNISERASDYYETSAMTTRFARGFDEADETKAEADHQKRTKRRSTRGGRRRAPTTVVKPEAGPLGGPPLSLELPVVPPEPSPSATSGLPAEDKLVADKPKRRRGSRGGRRRKKPTGDAPPSDPAV